MPNQLTAKGLPENIFSCQISSLQFYESSNYCLVLLERFSWIFGGFGFQSTQSSTIARICMCDMKARTTEHSRSSSWAVIRLLHDNASLSLVWANFSNLSLTLDINTVNLRKPITYGNNLRLQFVPVFFAMVRATSNLKVRALSPMLRDKWECNPSMLSNKWGTTHFPRLSLW